MSDVNPEVEPPVEPPKEPPKEPPAEPPKEPANAAEPEPPKAEPPKVELPKEPEPKPYWPEDWREKLADYASAGDEKEKKKELKSLQIIPDPQSLYGRYRELWSKFSSGGLVKVPGKDAKEEDVVAFHKAIGVPEKPDDYELKLENGATIGDDDKPTLGSYLEVMHKAGATPDVVNAGVNWYYSLQEQQAAQLDEFDDKNFRENKSALSEEYGASFNRLRSNAMGTMFRDAPGGADPEAENTLMARLLKGRTADGVVIGDDPDVVKWLINKSGEINPLASVVEEGGGSKQVEDEISTIEKFMREKRDAYFKDERMQARYKELISARNRARQA